VYYKTIHKIGQDFQFILQEVRHDMTNDELPNLEAAFYQALSKELQTKLVHHSSTNPPISINQNITRFNVCLTQALKEEKGLKTIMQFAERAAAWQMRGSYSPRNLTMRGPRTFLGYSNEEEEEPEGDRKQSVTFKETNRKTMLCMPVDDGEYGLVTLPMAFVAMRGSGCNPTQQDFMEEAIIAMDQTALMVVSIMEQALQKASGMREPAVCFGCKSIKEYANNCHHFWRN
jgi:hypothetical protein